MYEFKLATNSASGIARLLSKLPPDLDIEKLMRYISKVSLSQEEYAKAKAKYAPLSPSRPSSPADGRFTSAESEDPSCLVTAVTMCFVSLPYSSEVISSHKE
jgi:hypothetical protein